jgi:hypothetical protein
LEVTLVVRGGNGLAGGDVVGDDVSVSGDVSRSARPGWIRDVPVPRELDELHGPLDVIVGLPARLFWSGPDPRAVRWNLSDPSRRRDLYEIVLVEGTLDDVRALVNGQELVRLWDQMFLPRWVRAAWRPLIDPARSAA